MAVLTGGRGRLGAARLVHDPGRVAAAPPQAGWDDLDAVQGQVADLRASQRDYEPRFLHDAEQRQDAGPAWELMTTYHLAKAAEILGLYLSQGTVDGRYDVREQLEAQFDRAVAAAAAGRLMERETFVRLLARTARTLVGNSIWTVTRAVNSRVSTFVESMTSRDRQQPIFEMLPPQRRALREQGLLGSGHRSVVVSLPTSSGKTFIAQLRILQALNQFDRERGWVAYLAPTRALVNQLTLRLRRDFSDLRITVEKVSPALEIDGLEADMLVDADAERQFRLLVTTPEKLDLMLRGDWERRIGRPLTLVVVDEAHGLASGPRGLRLELLLATINRECRTPNSCCLRLSFPTRAKLHSGWRPTATRASNSGWTGHRTTGWSPSHGPRKGEARGDFGIDLLARHTTRNTIEIPEPLMLEERRPLGLSWSKAAKSPGWLAAATAQVLKRRGAVIVLVDQPRRSWSVAEAFKVDENRIAHKSEDLGHIQRFLIDEMGPDFPLAPLLEYGVGVHHAGLSDDTRTIVEWLTEHNELKVLVATTTIAQGVNFPVSGVVFASHQYPYGQEMPPEDFWNIAGRAGRVDQGDLGIIALAAPDDARFETLDTYIERSVGELASTLVDMVQKVEDEGSLLHLENWHGVPSGRRFFSTSRIRTGRSATTNGSPRKSNRSFGARSDSRPCAEVTRGGPTDWCAASTTMQSASRGSR